jgi:hypothetical protein
MIVYIGVLVFLLVAVFWLLLTTPAQKSAAFFVSAVPLILAAAGILLTLAGRGVIGVPLTIFGLSWWQRGRSSRPAPHPGGRKSTVRSAAVEMELDHDTGEMDGWVLTGRLAGARLSALAEHEMLSLYQEFVADADSIALIEAYLDRNFSGWRERTTAESCQGRDSVPGGEAMTKQEAYQILGLDPGASQQAIHQAWRRLIKGVHPDSGGSAFLAAKINTARDTLKK